MSRPSKIIIDIAAIKANCLLAQKLAPHSKTVAVVKADAYGHGAIEIASALEPYVEMLTVSCLEEALVLRSAGINKAILLLEGCFTASELAIASAQNCQLVVHNQQQISDLEKAKLSQPCIVWLKVDTGMHRLGLLPNEVHTAYNKLMACANVKAVLLMTHFSDADNLTSTSTPSQLQNFAECVKSIDADNVQLSLANSAGILAWPTSRSSWNRPGIMLYGLSPFSTSHTQADKLQPAMTLQSEIIAIRKIVKGESVGYGNTWTAQRHSLIATIAIGYGDGYPRNAPSGTPVLVQGQRVPLVGRVSMDLISVDVTDVADAQLGDVAVLWGKELSANEVAKWANTIGYELVTRMPSRVKRSYTA